MNIIILKKRVVDTISLLKLSEHQTELQSSAMATDEPDNS